MAQKFWWAIMASAAYLMPKMPKILIFPNFSKVSIFSSNIFQNGQIPTESRWSGPFWILSAHSRFSRFSKNPLFPCRICRDFAISDKVSRNRKSFHLARKHPLESQNPKYYPHRPQATTIEKMQKIFSKNAKNGHLSLVLNFASLFALLRRFTVTTSNEFRSLIRQFWTSRIFPFIFRGC